VLRRILPAVPALALFAVGCGGGSSAAGCDTAFQEQLDPASELHVLGDAEVDYLTDPPTSGPHGTAAIPEGALPTPISRSTQVAILEAGRALVQYTDAVPAQDVAVLAALADELVVVAPNPDLPEPVVVTAWTWKMTCADGGDESATAIADFADARIQTAPGSDVSPPS